MTDLEKALELLAKNNLKTSEIVKILQEHLIPELNRIADSMGTKPMGEVAKRSQIISDLTYLAKVIGKHFN